MKIQWACRQLQAGQSFSTEGPTWALMSALSEQIGLKLWWGQGHPQTLLWDQGHPWHSVAKWLDNDLILIAASQGYRLCTLFPSFCPGKVTAVTKQMQDPMSSCHGDLCNSIQVTVLSIQSSGPHHGRHKNQAIGYRSILHQGHWTQKSML